MPFSDNIEGLVYLRPEVTRWEVFWRIQPEAVVYALLLGAVAAWLLI
jgi:hypothetical protein